MKAEIEQGLEAALAGLRALHEVFDGNGWQEDAAYVKETIEYLDDVLADPTYSDIEGSDMPASGFSENYVHGDVLEGYNGRVVPAFSADEEDEEDEEDEISERDGFRFASAVEDL